MPPLSSIVMMSSLLKPHIFKFSLLIVMMLLGFNVCVFFQGWPQSKNRAVVTNEQPARLLRRFGDPSDGATIIYVTVFENTSVKKGISTLSPVESILSTVPPSVATTTSTPKATTPRVPEATSPRGVPKAASPRGAPKAAGIKVPVPEGNRRDNASELLRKSIGSILTHEGFKASRKPAPKPNKVIMKVLRPPKKKCSCKYVNTTCICRCMYSGRFVMAGQILLSQQICCKWCTYKKVTDSEKFVPTNYFLLTSSGM